MSEKRIKITESAIAVVGLVRQQHDDLIFHMSGGCCEGSSPLLLEKDEFYIDDNDHLLGTVADIEFYIPKEQFERWPEFKLTLDARKGHGAGFSLESALGYRFFVDTEVCNYIIPPE